MGRPNIAELKPWAGMLAGFGAVVLQHQLVADALHFDCAYGRATPFIGLMAMLIIASGASISMRVHRSEPDPQASRRFVANLSLLAAALSALLVAWMTLAGWILPACLP